MQKAEIITDPSLRELVNHGTSQFPFQYYYEDISQFTNNKMSYHWHKEFEFITVRHGTVTFKAGSLSYLVRAGDGIFINSGVVHELIAEEAGIIPNILFSGTFIAAEHTKVYEDYISCFFQSGISHIILSQEIEWQARMLQLLDSIYSLSTPDVSGQELDIHISVCQLWKLLFEHKQELIMTEQTGVSIRSQTRLILMMQYIEQHYAECITLADLAQAANISKSEAIRCFQTGLQTSPMSSLSDYRLFRARELILSTTDSITDISLQTGFESCSYFDRMFKKKFGITPRMLRSNR